MFFCSPLALSWHGLEACGAQWALKIWEACQDIIFHHFFPLLLELLNKYGKNGADLVISRAECFYAGHFWHSRELFPTAIIIINECFPMSVDGCAGSHLEANRETSGRNGRKCGARKLRGERARDRMKKMEGRKESSKAAYMHIDVVPSLASNAFHKLHKSKSYNMFQCITSVTQRRCGKNWKFSTIASSMEMFYMILHNRRSEQSILSTHCHILSHHYSCFSSGPSSASFVLAFCKMHTRESLYNFRSSHLP